MRFNVTPRTLSKTTALSAPLGCDLWRHGLRRGLRLGGDAIFANGLGATSAVSERPDAAIKNVQYDGRDGVCPVSNGTPNCKTTGISTRLPFLS